MLVYSDGYPVQHISGLYLSVFNSPQNLYDMKQSELYVGQYIERDDNSLVGIVHAIYEDSLTLRSAPDNELVEVKFEELSLWEDGLTDEEKGFNEHVEEMYDDLAQEERDPEEQVGLMEGELERMAREDDESDDYVKPELGYAEWCDTNP
jgi:hypothetical protein